MGLKFIFLSFRHILTWGAGKFGQLGNGKSEDSPDVHNITASLNSDSKIVQVSHTYTYSEISTLLLYRILIK